MRTLLSLSNKQYMRNNNEKLEYLKRGEVKTMEKDLSRLRETEAQAEREKVAQLRAEQEEREEKERQEKARQEAEAKRRAEIEAQKRAEEIRRLREEREEKAAAESDSAMAAKEEERRVVEPRRLHKEEEERRRFLERVTAKAEGREVPPPERPAPPPVPRPPGEAPAPGEVRLERRPEGAAPPKKFRLPKIPKPPVPKISGIFPKKPSILNKIWVKIIVALLIFAILAAVATFWFWYLVVREEKVPEPEGASPIVEAQLPSALISTEATRTLEFSDSIEIPGLISQLLKEEFDQNQFTRILLKNTKENKFVGLKGFFGSFIINPPQNFYDKLDNDFTLFVYSQEEGGRLGFVTKITGEELADTLSLWEKTMERDFENLFGPMGKEKPALVSYFKDGTYEETSFRFQTFSRQDLGMVYAIFDNWLVMTSSWKSMEKTLDKLKEKPVSRLENSSLNGALFILEKLTLKEKIGQLLLVGIKGKTLTPETKEMIETVRPGGIILYKENIESPAQVKKLAQDLREANPLEKNLPFLIAVDQEGGLVSRLEFAEEKTPQSEIKGEGQAYQIGLERGKELKELGINLNLAPVLDPTQPEDFLFSRSFQKNSDENSKLAKALILGQKAAGILTAIKHFPGYGDIAFNPEEKLAILKKIPEIFQFQKTIEIGPELVMTANVIYREIHPELPFTFSSKGIQLLKEKLGENHLVISDDLSQDYLLNEFSLKELVTLPVQAGVDILIFSERTPVARETANLLFEAVRQGSISEEQINSSVLKIIKLKQELL